MMHIYDVETLARISNLLKYLENKVTEQKTAKEVIL